MSIAYFNGNWIEENDTTTGFGFNDRLRLGDGVFDTMLCVIDEQNKAQTIHADKHFERLSKAAKLMQIPALPTTEELTALAHELIDKNALQAGRYALNTIFTRGPASRGLMPASETQTTPSLVMKLSPASSSFPEINAITARQSCRNEYSPLSQIKSTNYGDNILCLLEAKAKGANEALISNIKGDIVCASSGNIFVILDGKLHTPPLSDGVLDGVTRQIMIEKYPVIISSINMQDLQKAEGIYITNSIKGCMPISILNAEKLPPPLLTIEQDFHLS